MQKKPKKPTLLFVLLGGYALFIAASYLFNLEAGTKIAGNFVLFIVDMFKLFPAAFILVGLFMVWVDRSVVEKYFGEHAGAKGHIGAILLSCTTLYPFIVVLPMASALYQKGAKLEIVLTYLGASAICRIPMTIFEASFLGLEFTLIRYAVSLPLVVLSSVLIGRLMKNHPNETDAVEAAAFIPEE